MNAPGRNWLERLVFGVGLLMVASVLAYLAHLSINGTDGPARLRVHTGAPRASGDRWMVPLTVTNEGGRTAEGVRIVVTLAADDVRGVGERGEVELAYVPRHSRRKAWVTFLSDPRSHDVVVHIAGYEEP